MNLTEEMRAFIRAEDTVQFVTEGTEAFLAFVRESREVLVTQTLAGRYLVCYIKAADLPHLQEAMGSAFASSMPVVLGLLDRPALEAAGVIQVQNQPYLDLRGRGVLLGFVDTGIDFTQPCFRYEDGTSKIRFLYDQTDDAGPPPEGFDTGREFTGEDIDRALASENPAQVVSQRDGAGHGTFLASVAAGRSVNGFTGAAPDAEIVAVKLRAAPPFFRQMYCVPPQQQEAYDSNAVILGVEYIIRKARQLQRPVVICLGLGTNFGSHDGYSVFARYLGEVAAIRGVCLCAAAGNEAQARHHQTGVLSADGTTESIDLKVGEQAGDVCLTILSTISDRISVSVRSPTGELAGRFPARPETSELVELVLEDARVQVEYHFPLPVSGSQYTMVRILDATEGLWTINLHGDIVISGRYHVWLPITGFVSPTVEFLNASPDYTITSPGTALGLICCGAYDSATGSLYPPSSRGPALSGAILPDFVAPGVDVGGFYPYGYGTMSGTSAATAVLAGVCALLMQWGVAEGNDVSLSTAQIRAYLIRGCVRSSALTYPNNQWGYGTIQLMQTFQLMREV